MKEFFYKHHWTFLVLLFSIYVAIGFFFYKCLWINTWLQTGAIAITILFSVMLMIRANKKSDEATQEKLKFYQEENKKHIDTIQQLNKEQIDALKESVKEQMAQQTALSEKYISEARSETERIIKSFQESTEKEIESFVQHSRQITDGLEDMVEHLSEINKDNKEMLEHSKKQTEIEEKKFAQRNDQLQNMLRQQQATMLKYKPELQFYLEEDGIFFVDLKFVLNNSGGEATSIQLDIIFSQNSGNVESRKFTKVASNLKRNEQTSFTLTRAKKLRGYDLLEVKVLVWDVNQNRYMADWFFDREDKQWFRLDLDDQNLIS